MKVFGSLLFGLLLSNTVWALDPTVNINIDGADSNAGKVVGITTEYNVVGDYTNLVKSLIGFSREAVWMEAHGGGMVSVDLTGKIQPALALMAKVNLFSPKRPYNTQTMGLAAHLEELIAHYKISLTPDVRAEIDSIKEASKKYDSEIFFKRWSIGFLLPYTPTLDSNGGYVLGSSVFKFDPFFTAGIDITDYVTVQIGVKASTFNEYSLSITTDLTSPVSLAMNNFGNWIRQLLL